MSPERWQQIEDLLDKALQRNPEGWPTLLEEACGGDAQLRRTVATLLERSARMRGSGEPVGEPPAPVLVGQEVDGYRVLELVGRGGMGVVYKAEDLALSRLVALKFIRPGLADSEASLRRFRAEARALARVDSSHIVSIYALRETEAGSIIVMEYVEGKTLEEVLRQGLVALPDALALTRQMLAALRQAHRTGVAHRDVKPQNVIVTPGGTAKVTDFGLAKILDPGRAHTITEGVMGTLCYMSPEQVEGSRRIDHRSDLYSVGMVIYELLTGRLPFDEESSTVGVMRSILEGDLPPPSAHRPSLPPALSAALMKAIEKDPEDRYPNAEAMQRALEEAWPLQNAAIQNATLQSTGAQKSAAPRGVEPKRSGSSSTRPDAPPLRKREGELRPLSPRDHPVRGALLAVLVLLGLVAAVLTSQYGQTARPDDLSPAQESPAPESAEQRADTREARSSGDLPAEGPAEKPDATVGETSGGGAAGEKGEERAREPKEPRSAGEPLAGEAARERSRPPDAPPFQKAKGSETSFSENDLPSTTGRLHITSEPSGARLLIDGRVAGSTPASVGGVIPGMHTLVLDKEAYWPDTVSLYVQTGQEVSFSRQLRRITGTLQVNVHPAASLHVDGRRHGEEQQFQMRLPATAHDVRLTHPTLGTWEQSVELAPDQTRTVEVDFEEEFPVSITAFDAEGAFVRGRIFIDGKPAGRGSVEGDSSEESAEGKPSGGEPLEKEHAASYTPRRVHLRAGLHRIEVRKDGYEQIALRVGPEEIARGSTQINFDGAPSGPITVILVEEVP